MSRGGSRGFGRGGELCHNSKFLLAANTLQAVAVGGEVTKGTLVLPVKYWVACCLPAF